MSETSEQHVRVGNDLIVHSVTPGRWTTCGIMHSTNVDAFHFVKGVPTSDPVDCMACLVQETRGAVDTLTIRGILKLPMPVHVIEFVVNTEPKK